MSALNATAAGPSDLLAALSARTVTAVPSRPDESFWKDVFDQAETLEMATANAALLPQEARSADTAPAEAEAFGSGLGNEVAGAEPAAAAGASISPDARPAGVQWGTADADFPQASVFSQAARLPTSAARWRAEQSYGLAAPEPVAPPAQAKATQAPAAVNATLVTLLNGELKLYLRAAGLSASQAIEAASLAGLPWPDGQAPDIAEVVLNGQTIYTRGVDKAPSFILTC